MNRCRLCGNTAARHLPCVTCRFFKLTREQIAANYARVRARYEELHARQARAALRFAARNR